MKLKSPVLLVFFLITSIHCFSKNAIGKDSLAIKNTNVHDSIRNIKTPKINVDILKRYQKVYKNYQSTTKKEKLSNSVNKEYKTFPSIDKQLTSDSFKYAFQNREPEFTDQFLAEKFPDNPAIDSIKDKAEKIFGKLEELKKYVDVLTGDKLIEFPVGLKKKDATGNTVTIAVSEAKMFPKYAELKIFAKLSIPQRNIDLFFGAEGVKFSHDGAFLGDTKLVLLGNQPIPFNADNWLLTIKGDSNMKTGAFGDASFVTVNCNGLKEISLEADLRVSRNVLLPTDTQGNYLCGDSKDEQFTIDEKTKEPTTTLDEKCYVGTSFSVKASGWNDLLAEISLPHFEITGLKGWGFHLEAAVLDLSDTRNSPNISFPEVYDRYLIPGNEGLWRGVYAQSIQVTLPKAIKKNGSQRTQFGATDLILDSNGITGNFYGTNLLTKKEGSAGKWPFTIDSLELKLEVNKLKGGSLAGSLQVPIMDKAMGYEGWISSKEYGLTVITEEAMNVPVFLAEMNLQPNSSVTVKVTDDNIYPSANLTGSLTVKANIGQKSAEETLQPIEDGNSSSESSNQSQKTDFEMPGIVFEELQINTEPGLPFIKAEKFEYSGSNKAFNFPVNIDNVKLLTPSNTGVGLGFDLTINFDDKGSNASTKLAVMGKVEDQDNLQTWKYDTINVDAVYIDIERSGVKIAGGLEVMKDDPTYGDGFKGELQVDITKINLQANAKAMFGNKDFRYWFVDVWTENSKGGDSKLLINKFVGGLSYSMKKTSTNSNWTPSESTYVPYAENGLSLKAGIEIATKSKSFQGKAFLEMDFNRNGGLNRIGFTGDGSLMLKSQSGSSGGAMDLGKGKLKSIADKVNKFAEDNIDKIEDLANSGNYLAISKDAIPKGEVAAEGNIGVYVGIEKDFTTDTFHGEFEVYIDLKQIRGASDKANPSNTLAGRAVIHTSPDKWYLHVGTPETPISLAFIVGPETFTVNGYFMTGNVMPTQLKPHYRVLQILGDDIMGSNRSSSELTAGRGFAFGLSFEYRKDFKWSIFYAFIEAGIGFDVMHREYPGASCIGHSGELGNNGWYSLGQVYAYLYGEFGVRIKLFGTKKSFRILEAGVAAMLRGQFPNPSYFEGYVGAYYSVMGGLVSGRMRLHAKYGDKCVIARDADDGLEVPIISDITPMDEDTDIDVFSVPQIAFNYAIDRQVTISESTGDHSYKVLLNEAKLIAEGKEIPINLDWDYKKTSLTYDLKNELLPSEKEVTVRVKVTFQEKVNGTWIPVMSGGREVNETKEVNFKTSKAPDYIPLQNIEYMYPVKDQQYFFPEEYNQGYVQLDKNQEYLFDPNYTYKSQFTATTGEISRSDLNYDASKRRLYYSMPQAQTNTGYKFDVMVFHKADVIDDYVKPDPEEILLDQSTEGEDEWFTDISGGNSTNTSATAKISGKSAERVINTGESKSLLDYNFKSSTYNTFREKMRDIDIVYNNLLDFASYDLEFIHMTNQDHEGFGEVELLGSSFTNNQPLVTQSPILNDTYYKSYMKPDVYDFDKETGENLIKDLGITIPINHQFGIATYYRLSLIHNPDNTIINTRYAFVYDIALRYKKDYLKLRNKVTNVYYETENRSYFEKHKDFLNSSFQVLKSEKYDTQVNYSLPGSTHIYEFQSMEYKK